MQNERASGILLHPTSLPGPHGIGDLGLGARRFVDYLAEAGQTYWQVLPLGPTGLGDSPYTSLSSFAGNPLLISLEVLIDSGLLDPDVLDDAPGFAPDHADYAVLTEWKPPLLERAARRFLADAGSDERASFAEFCENNAAWLDDFALFMVAKSRLSSSWNTAWPDDIALRRPGALKRWRSEEAELVENHKAVQYFFFEQWGALRRYAAERGIRLIGDLPIYVAADSTDLWAARHLFQVDDGGRPTVVAGVPPDYFSDTGQLWGNPLYDWKAMAQDGFAWWLSRLRSVLRMVDVVRIDHFRAFESFWQVPAHHKTAVKGQWIKAPGTALFRSLKKELGHLPIIAEDLGFITPKVKALRDRFELPGMIVLQFAFGLDAESRLDPCNPFLPHNHRHNAVVYTGTHDNDTSAGWYEKLTPAEREAVRRYLGMDDREDIAGELIRTAMASVARTAIIPMQDALSLGSDARMNTPSTVGSNWRWRCRAEAFNSETAARLREVSRLYGRNAFSE